MKTLDLIQGSAEWLEVRSRHFTASEAPAMLGLSKYVSRDELLRQKATGITDDVDSATQRRFDAGHAAEALARPIAEKIIGEEIYPVTGSLEVDGLPLLASFDGLTMMEDSCWESKIWNDEFAAQVANGEVPDTHWPQLEQQLLISGAERVLLTVTDGTEENTVYTWYASRPNRREQLIAGWKQFSVDLLNYRHAEVIPAPVAAPINELPSLAIEIVGNVVASNLTQWRGVVQQRIAEINTDLQSDQDFADADKMVKFLDDGEKRIEIVKAQAQSQATSIDEVFRALDDIKATMRAKRLELDKLVKARKENIRGEIAQAGQQQYAAHCEALNARLKGPYFPGHIIAKFGEVMKGKKTVASLRSAVSDELAAVKIESNALAERIDANLRRYGELAAGHEFLFRDLFGLVTNSAESFTAIVQQRIAEHVEAKRREEEAQREQIRREEEAKAAAKAKVEADKIAAEEKAASDAKLAQERAEFEREKQEVATADAKRFAAERAELDRQRAEIAKQTDQATVSSNGASSTPEASQVLNRPAEAVADPAPVAAVAPVAESVTPPLSWAIRDDIERALEDLTMEELRQVAHFIDRLVMSRKTAA